MSASPSPEHEVIEVETPPNSPSAALSFASPVSVTDEWQDKVNSPSKRQRVHSVRGQSAKRGKRNGRHPRHDATEVSPEPVLQHDQSNARVTTNDGRGPEAIEDLIDLDAHGEYQGSISYEEYVIAVVEGRAGFQAIRRSLFAVQGWDDRRQCTTAGWFHLQYQVIGTEVHAACLCTQGQTSCCVHTQYLERYWDGLEFAEELGEYEGPKAVLIMGEVQLDGTWKHLFSVLGSHLGGHAIVTHIGENSTGTWTCTKDRGEFACRHINDARNQLNILLHRDPSVTEPDGHVEGFSIPVSKSYNDDQDRSISHLPILPPAWAALPTDPNLYDHAPPLTARPERLLLSTDSQCLCKTAYDAERPTIFKPCTIYTLSRAFTTLIEVQSCGDCAADHRRFIGPDRRDLGLFNLNNHLLFSHDVLDEYTSAFTSSETPFVAWVSTVRRRYTTHRSEHAFVHEDTFRRAWFAYTRLQCFEGDMTCPRCGPSPEDVIWDGVTLAFSKRHLLASLRPPTTISPSHSNIRSDVRYYAQQQLIESKEIRKMVRQAMKDPAAIEDDELIDPKSPSKHVAAASAMLEYLTLVDTTANELKKLNGGMGTIFINHFNSVNVIARQKVPIIVRRIFEQIAAEESVLQLATRAALGVLGIFIASPTAQNASQLVCIPALYNLLVLERDRRTGVYSEAVLSLSCWIYIRGMEVLKTLKKYDALPVEPPSSISELNWRATGVCYSMPQIRHRPTYPRLTHDQRQDSGGSRGAKCSKYYSQYGEQRQTGGIMCAWCTHSICYGFHCIPKGEGRNDVFSAMVTRWLKPPKRVIYDFACALGPYCMLREPDFFADTQFLIDAFHATGHTKCSPAAFLSNYAAVDPRLAKLNSSAAECGNGGIARIRKSVSYMSQTRSIQYTKVFISVWNRQRIRAIIDRM